MASKYQSPAKKGNDRKRNLPPKEAKLLEIVSGVYVSVLREDAVVAILGKQLSFWA